MIWLDIIKNGGKIPITGTNRKIWEKLISFKPREKVFA